jgi:hypothetical protein
MNKKDVKVGRGLEVKESDERYIEMKTDVV